MREDHEGKPAGGGLSNGGVADRDFDVWGLRQAGINKVRMGITSLDEINRVTVD